MTATLLEIDSMNVSIGGRAILQDVGFKVSPGEILGVVGASGSGKSMTALAIMGLLPEGAAITGKLLLNGESLIDRSARDMRRLRGKAMGMVFQEPMTTLNPLMRIGDQVTEALRIHSPLSMGAARNAGRNAWRNSAREVLTQVGLPEELGAWQRLPYELSGGQRQRAAIAMAVINSPPLLIADEPTTALDVITQSQVLELLRSLARARQMGLILITHDLAVVSQLADRVAVMQQGRIVDHGVTSDVLRNSRVPHTRALLQASRLQPKRAAAVGPSPVVLQVTDVVREFPRPRRSWRHPATPVRAVDHVTLAVNAGETVGLVGESGSGKSSLLRVILALDRPQQGQVKLSGDARTRSIQAVFQDPYGSFDPRWRVERLIAESFYAMASPPNAAETRRRVAAVLEQVGLSADDAQRFPHEFSGGQRQRIAIARALIAEPAVIAFDEAVSALDVLIRGQILELLTQLASRLDVGFLFVSHDLHVIRAIADRVYVMQAGRIVEQGSTESVFSSPQHPYTRALIAATPTLEAEKSP
jgi:peptide/nickel transport system ATP-binding protein